MSPATQIWPSGMDLLFQSDDNVLQLALVSLLHTDSKGLTWNQAQVSWNQTGLWRHLYHVPINDTVNGHHWIQRLKAKAIVPRKTVVCLQHFAPNLLWLVCPCTFPMRKFPSRTFTDGVSSTSGMNKLVNRCSDSWHYWWGTNERSC